MSDPQVVLLSAITVASVWLGSPIPSALVAAIVLALWWPHRRDLFVLGATLGLVAGLSADRAWERAVPGELGHFRGWATVASDPMPVGKGERVTLEIEGQRFEAIVFGSSSRRIAPRQAGEQVEVIAVRRRSTGPWARRARIRHVVGEIVIEHVGAHDPGGPIARASNRVRRQLRSAATQTMPADQAALFTGLVIGDDAAQPPAMVSQFREAGLSHLTAVSGQNVAFVLAVAALGLRRLPRWWRLAATLAVIAWFVLVTRVEPSVARAGMMAGLSALAFALGRERHPVRILALAVITLVLVDPLLVWSVAFWLSVGATFGVSALAPVLACRLAGPGWLVAPLSVTIGAQVGVLLPSWLVFHRLPALGFVANLLAVPVAGIVMLYGIPAGLAAAALPGVAGVVMMPCVLGTRWVSTVAALVDRFDPAGRGAFAAWAVQLLALACLLRPAPRSPEGVARPSPVER